VERAVSVGRTAAAARPGRRGGHRARPALRRAYWNWDPRQTSILISLLFYGAYLALRGAVEDRDTRGRLSAAYALIGLVVTPFLFWIMPRITFTLHPEPVVNMQGKVEIESRMWQVLMASTVGFTALFFWTHNLACRLAALRERRAALKR
jgi:heme exporter protein C